MHIYNIFKKQLILFDLDLKLNLCVIHSKFLSKLMMIFYIKKLHQNYIGLISKTTFLLSSTS